MPCNNPILTTSQMFALGERARVRAVFNLNQHGRNSCKRLLLDPFIGSRHKFVQWNPCQHLKRNGKRKPWDATTLLNT